MSIYTLNYPVLNIHSYDNVHLFFIGITAREAQQKAQQGTLPQVTQDESGDVEDGEGEVVRGEGDKEEEDSGVIELGLDWKSYVVVKKRKVLAQIVANEQNGGKFFFTIYCVLKG